MNSNQVRKQVNWVGARLARKEDGRYLRGAGKFVDDLERHRTLHAAFVRSAFSAAEITNINTELAYQVPGVRHVFTAADLGDPYMEAILEREEFRPTRMHLLASRKIRFFGEPYAVVLADHSYAAEDGAHAVQAQIVQQPAVADIDEAISENSPLVHAAGNCLVDLTMFDDASLEEVFASAPVLIEAQFNSGRLAASPMEGRACLAEWDERDEQVVIHVSTQVPHQVRSGIAHALRMAEKDIRVIAPDVGGGFGLKCVVGREETIVAGLARQLHKPIKWIEDRQENLTAAFHGHEQRYDIKAAFDVDGRILGLAADIRCDVGAYSVYPFTCAVEPLMASTELPGIYRVPVYRVRGRGIATNKPPTAPYRGVSRPQIVLVMERLMEKAAARLGIHPLEVRRRNIISKFPHSGNNGIVYDEGSYRESLELAERKVREASWLAHVEQLRAAGASVGIGYSCFSERTAYGTATMSQRRMRMTPGYDTSCVRMTPTGDVIVTTGTCSQGQGHETTFAQIVADVLGVHPRNISVRQGDTDLTSYGWGTFGSRSIVIGGEAARMAGEVLADKLRRMAGHMLGVKPSDIELVEGQARTRGLHESAISIAELASMAHFRSHTLPEGDFLPLEGVGTADPPGTFSNACHVAMVQVDTGTGEIRVLKYLVVEDCGVVINPLVVDGQVRGGVAQGIGAALHERIIYDDGRPIVRTFADYLLPTANEIGPIDIYHLQTPSKFGKSGAKGMGEGGTIGAPAAVLNAVNDALAEAGVEFDHIPVLSSEVIMALQLKASQ